MGEKKDVIDKKNDTNEKQREKDDFKESIFIS